MQLNWYHWHHVKYIQKHFTFCMTILCKECRSKSKFKSTQQVTASTFCVDIWACVCESVRVWVLANSKCIFIQHSSVRLFVNVIRKHTQYTHSSSECVALWASLENKLWFSSSANMRALSPDFFFVERFAAKVYLHMIRTILVLIDSLLRAQRLCVVSKCERLVVFRWIFNGFYFILLILSFSWEVGLRVCGKLQPT